MIKGMKLQLMRSGGMEKLDCCAARFLKRMVGCALFVTLLLGACSKKDKTTAPATPAYTVNSNPAWKAEAKSFTEGPSGAFDDLSVKDPSIVFSGGNYHLFYTVRSKSVSGWQMAHAAAPQISQLRTATRTYLSALNGGSYFCAPQVFHFPAKNKWFIICQSGLGASLSTNTDVSNPAGWAQLQSLGFGDGIDFWCISDGNYVYCFYSAQDGSYTIKRRRTTVANFPYNWDAPVVVATNTFEAPHVYKNKADGKYYMVVEDIARHQELWVAGSLGGTWTKLAEKWASKDNLSYLADRWTDQVSHIELLRSATDDKMEIDDINRCDMLIQGVTNDAYTGPYENIPYDLGLIRNY